MTNQLDRVPWVEMRSGGLGAIDFTYSEEGVWMLAAILVEARQEYSIDERRFLFEIIQKFLAGLGSYKEVEAIDGAEGTKDWLVSYSLNQSQFIVDLVAACAGNEETMIDRHESAP